MPEPRHFDPLALLRVLVEHDVQYVVIGGYAAILHGSSMYTNDADICPAADLANLERLCAALGALEARIRTSTEPDGLPFSCSANFLQQMQMLNLVTRYGDFDLSFSPAGFPNGFAELADRAVVYDIGGLRVSVAALRDIIVSKEIANRDKDRAALPVLKALEDEIAEQQRRAGE